VAAGGSLATVRNALANPDLRRLQLGFAGSAIGRWAGGIALTVYSYSVGGAGAVAAQIVVAMLPAAIAAPLLSTLADRRSRVRLMVTSEAARIIVTLAMAALIALEAPLAVIFAAAALNGILGSAFEPAKQALLPDLARSPDELTAANVVSSGIDSTSFFIGPALGGLVLAVSSPQTVLVVTAALLLWSALLVSRICEPPREAAEAPEDGEPGESFLSATRSGFGTVAHEPGVRLVVGLLSAQTFVAGLEGTLIAALALDTLDLGEAGLGYLEASIGIGGLVGAGVAVGLVGRRRLGLAFAVGCVLWGVPFAIIGAVPEVAVAAVGLAVVGVANTLVDVAGISLLQRITPAALMGRVFGILESLIMATIALGAAAGPLLISLFDVEGALIAQGLFLPIVVGLCAAALRRVDAAADAVVPDDVLDLLGRVPMFAPLPRPILERLAAVVECVQVPAGELVFAQGDPGDRFYVIAKGRVEVLIDGRHVRDEGPGESFGEIALLRGRPRTATIRASEDTELVVLDRDFFLAAVTGHAASREAADHVIAGRLTFARPAPLRV
jgi:MFS family permease